MNKTACLKKAGTPLLAALLLITAGTSLADGEAWPQPESAYNSTQPRAQWLDTSPGNQLPQPVAPQQLAAQGAVQYPAAAPYAPSAYGGYPAYPAYGYVPQRTTPMYGYGYGYGRAPRHHNNWWPGSGSWPSMNNWSMPSPSFSTPSFSMPSNPFGW